MIFYLVSKGKKAEEAYTPAYSKTTIGSRMVDSEDRGLLPCSCFVGKLI